MRALAVTSVILPVALSGFDGPRPGFNNMPGGPTRYAAFSILHPNHTSTLTVSVGTLHKSASNPLFRGTEPWERDINNGYSSVLYDENATAAGNPAFRVYYSASDAQFGGSIPGESRGSAILLAQSRDGVLGWEKPALGRVPYNTSANGGGVSAANNILFDGTTALAVYDDCYREGANSPNRFKIWGNLPGIIGSSSDGSGAAGDGGSDTSSDGNSSDMVPPSLGYTAQLGGSAVSANGLNFTGYRRLQDPSSSATVRGTWRFDAATSMYYDLRQQRYVSTMRAFRPCATCGECPIWWQPSGGCQGHIGKACSAAQCNRTVRAIGVSLSDPGADARFQSTTWGPNHEVHAEHSDPTHQLYSQISFPFYNCYIGIVMVFSALDPPNTYGKGKVHCELAWSADGSKYERLAPGTDFVPLGNIATRDFDSHICFASAHPVKLATETRIYYFGGDGPHYSPAWPDPLHRNSSFGMATLRPDGFVALRPRTTESVGKATTMPLVASGRHLMLTADTAPSGSVTITVHAQGLPGGSAICAPVTERNVTDEVLQGCDLSAVAQQTVTLDFDVRGSALLYTVGFS